MSRVIANRELKGYDSKLRNGPFIMMYNEGMKVPAIKTEKIRDGSAGIFSVLEKYIKKTGLYLAKRIVTDHGGEIWATSDGAGKGSTFWVRVPARAEQTTKEQITNI